MSTNTFSVQKLFLFVLSNLLVGLLQIWILYIILRTMHKSPDISILLGDGGLFFFATSLAVSSYLLLYSQKAKPATIDLNLTIILVLFVILPAIIIYTVVLSTQLGTVSPFHNCIGTQCWCALSSLTYAVYAGARTGYFSS
jgi:hypothetical protein